MKTLHLETGRHLYGGPRQVLLLLDGLKKRGVEVMLACPTGSAIADAATAAGHEVITHDIGGDLDVSAISFLSRTIERRKPDLLHAHSRRGADFFGGLAATIARIPAVLTRRVDNPDTPVVGSLKYLAYDRVVAISDAVHAQLERQGVTPAKLRTIRSSIDATACQPTWTREQFLAEFNLQPGNRVVAVVAQLIPRKGHALLLEAWPQILARCPDARLLVFGRGPLEAELRAQAGQPGLQLVTAAPNKGSPPADADPARPPSPASSITFAGFRPDLRAFLGRIDLLVHPATREGLGVGVLEAQAAGVPVVALNAGGVPEVVVDGVTGLLVAPGNAATSPAALALSLAAAVSQLLDDPGRRRQLGTAAAARIRAEFSPDRMVEDYIALYREVLA
jgi:glycosyltransferase involved in cell wall biosynthesis